MKQIVDLRITAYATCHSPNPFASSVMLLLVGFVVITCLHQIDCFNLSDISSDVLLYLIFANFDTLRFYSIFGFQGTNFQESLPIWLNFLSVIRNHKLLCLYTVHLYFLITGKNQHLYKSVHSFQSFQRFSFLESGSHLLSHTVSSIVPSAACVLTVVFGMGTGVSHERIDTRNI